MSLNHFPPVTLNVTEKNVATTPNQKNIPPLTVWSSHLSRIRLKYEACRSLAFDYQAALWAVKFPIQGFDSRIQGFILRVWAVGWVKFSYSRLKLPAGVSSPQASTFCLLSIEQQPADCRPSVPRGNNDTHQWIFVDLPAWSATEPCWGTGDLSDPESWLWPGVKHLHELNFSSMTCSVPTLAVCRYVVHSTLFIAGHLTSLQYSSVQLNQHIGPMNILDLPLCSSCQTALGRLVTFIVIYWIWILEIKNGCMVHPVTEHFCHLRTSLI